MVQPDTLLHEAFVLMFDGTRFNADRRPTTDAIEEAIAVEHRRHAELGQKFAVKGPCGGKIAYGQHDMRHSIDFDRHSTSIRYLPAALSSERVAAAKRHAIPARSASAPAPPRRG